MSRNILLIVEGSVDEQNVLSDAFTSYGFNAITCKQKLNIDEVGQLEKYEYSKDKNNVVVIEGPRNRIHDFLKLVKESNVDIEKVFNYSYGFFQGIFLIYDVDHNDCDDIKEMGNRFADETSGMLLLSSPCLEVIGDYNRDRKEETYKHLSEYKTDINSHYHGRTYEIIKANFNEFMLYFLDKNYHDFQEANVMEHPRLIVDEINKKNIRINCRNQERSYVVYRYFSTVLYVAIAHANSLTVNIDNYETVRSFFLSRTK